MNRSEILRLYRRIIRLSRDWIAQEPSNTNKERQYIREEAQKGFKAHKSETDPEKIRDLSKEAEKRVEIACHYQIPYDRPSYLPPSTSFDVDPRSKTAKQRTLHRSPTPTKFESRPPDTPFGDTSNRSPQ
uniref:Complex1_LYR_dom domain-containing protein n=1 Tax=Globodera pallida TaxID=36090 RepID=A0A183CME5_GLOPA